MTNYEHGGTVTIEFNDGSVVKDATVRIPPNSITDIRWFTFGGYTHHLIGMNGEMNPAIKRVVEYTPPKPEWDRPEVRAVKDIGLGIVYVRMGDFTWMSLRSYIRSDTNTLAATGAQMFEVWAVAP